jgi:alkylation response protein AidB-like acyl-CoA dehydrogenase
MAPITITPGGGFLLEPTGSAVIVTAESLGEDRLLMKQTADEFMRREVDPRLEDIEEKKPGVLRELLTKAGEVGLLGHDVPEEYGGLGGDKLSSSLISESMSRIGSWAVTFGCHTGIGTMPVVLFGNAEQRARYLPRLATGELVAAYALTEPTAGSDALAAKTTARLTADGKHYRLDGSKLYITNGGIADLYTVFAKVDGDAFTAFLVDRSTPGLTVGAEEHKLGIRGSSTTTLFFDGCLVPVENLLGAIGKGHKIAFNILNIGRYKLGVGALGGAKSCLELGIRFAKERRQFDKPIAEFDLIRKKLGGIATQIFVAESMAYRTVGLIDARIAQIEEGAADAQRRTIDAIEEHSIEASIIKVFGSEMLFETADETLQVFGGAGFIADYPIERISRDSRIFRIFEGTNEINRLLVPGTLLKRAMQGRLGLMGLLPQIQAELADPPRISRAVPPGPLGSQQQKVDRAKRAVGYGIAKGVERYMQQIADKQELLGVLADGLILVYAMDSAVTRALQLVAERGEAAAQIPIAMTQLFVATAHERVFDLVREMLMWMNQGATWEKDLAEVNQYYELTRVNTFSLRRQIARHVIDRDGYALA